VAQLPDVVGAEQVGVGARHWPDTQVVSPGQVPHEVPHTGSAPHTRPEQSGVHTVDWHWPNTHVWLSSQVPQDVEHLDSVPHFIAPHSGTHGGGPHESESTAIERARKRWGRMADLPAPP